MIPVIGDGNGIFVHQFSGHSLVRAAIGCSSPVHHHCHAGKQAKTIMATRECLLAKKNPKKTTDDGS